MLGMVEEANATFDGLVGEENPEDIIQRIGGLNHSDLRRIVLARVVEERRRRAIDTG